MMSNKSNYHNVYFKPNPERSIVWKEICRYLKMYIGKNDSVLEIGAGYCDFINNIDARKKMAIDVWPGIKNYANNNVEVKILDLANGLPIKYKFNIVLASNLLEHLEMDKAEKLLKDVFTCLTRGGKLIIIQPNFALNQKNYFDDYTHKTIFTDISLSSLLVKVGFKITYICSGFLPLTLKSKFPKWGFLIKLYLMSPFKPFAGQMLIVGRK